MPYQPNWAKICCVTTCRLCLMDFMIKQRPKRSYHVSSSCQIPNPIFLEFFGVENLDRIFAIFLQNYDPHGPWDPSYSIPGEKRILEFFGGGGRKKQVPWAPWRGPTPLYLDRVNVTCRYNFSRPWFHVITSLPSPHMVNGRCHRLDYSIAALLIFAACTHMFLKVSSQLQHNSTSELGLYPRPATSPITVRVSQCPNQI